MYLYGLLKKSNHAFNKLTIFFVLMSWMCLGINDFFHWYTALIALYLVVDFQSFMALRAIEGILYVVKDQVDQVFGFENNQ